VYIIEKPRRIDLLKITVRKATARHCVGCRDNFYNGHNPYDIKRCWLLDKARLVRRKRVGISDVPPWHWQPVVVVPECFRMQGYVHVNPAQLG
jgi:hypothetical protein